MLYLYKGTLKKGFNSSHLYKKFQDFELLEIVNKSEVLSDFERTLVSCYEKRIFPLRGEVIGDGVHPYLDPNSEFRWIMVDMP